MYENTKRLFYLFKMSRLWHQQRARVTRTAFTAGASPGSASRPRAPRRPGARARARRPPPRTFSRSHARYTSTTLVHGQASGTRTHRHLELITHSPTATSPARASHSSCPPRAYRKPAPVSKTRPRHEQQTRKTRSAYAAQHRRGILCTSPAMRATPSQNHWTSLCAPALWARRRP